MKNNREIKFRVWDTEKKKFIYDSNDLFIRINGTAHFIIDREKRIETWEKGDSNWPDYLTVQQYTGFKDADGIEIYDGDIIEYEDKRKRLVRWCEEGLWEAAPINISKDYCASFDIDNQSYMEYNGYDDAALSMVGGLWNGPIKIIGNMFENPELLKL
jgi:uncharacterized phage protein (TIGR01671 family)